MTILWKATELLSCGAVYQPFYSEMLPFYGKILDGNTTWCTFVLVLHNEIRIRNFTMHICVGSSISKYLATCTENKK